MPPIKVTEDAGPDRPGTRPRICVIVTVDITLQYLCRGRLEYFMQQGFDVTAVCAPTPLASEIEARGVHLHTAPLRRATAPWQDIKAIWNLFRFLRRERFDLVEISTPKAALVGAVAARLARVPCVVHLLRGLAYQHQKGMTGRLLRAAQKLACRWSHRVISVSHSMREQACADGICKPDHIDVLGAGSSNGIDLAMFAPEQHRAGRQEIRRRYELQDDDLVVGFVGRITSDKGAAELAQAFVELHRQCESLRLLILGDLEHRDQPPTSIIETLQQHAGVRWAGWQKETPPYYAAMDWLVLPSFREGFANVLLEAAAMELPVVTTDATGCRDAVRQGETGFCVPVGDTEALQEKMRLLASDEELRNRMGQAARRHVETHFACETVWQLQEQEFRRLIRLSS